MHGATQVQIPRSIHMTLYACQIWPWGKFLQRSSVTVTPGELHLHNIYYRTIFRSSTLDLCCDYKTQYNFYVCQICHWQLLYFYVLEKNSIFSLMSRLSGIIYHFRLATLLALILFTLMAAVNNILHHHCKSGLLWDFAHAWKISFAILLHTEIIGIALSLSAVCVHYFIFYCIR